MSERFYIVSESELLALWNAGLDFDRTFCNYNRQQEILEKAEAACRARPVPEWATHFAQIHYTWLDPKSYWATLGEYEEIKR